MLDLLFQDKILSSSNLKMLEVANVIGDKFLFDTAIQGTTAAVYVEDIVYKPLSKSDRDLLWQFLELVWCTEYFTRTICIKGQAPITFIARRLPDTLSETITIKRQHVISFSIQEEVAGTGIISSLNSPTLLSVTNV